MHKLHLNLNRTILYFTILITKKKNQVYLKLIFCIPTFNYYQL